MLTIYNEKKPHPKGRYTLKWPTGKMISIPGMRNGKETMVPEMNLATYEVTGKANAVYVEVSTLPAGKWMERDYFDFFYSHIINNLDGECLKPLSKNWKRKTQ